MTIAQDDPCRLTIGDGFAVLSLNRPARGNALATDMVERALAALDAAVADPQVHSLVLCGVGRHFCTGFDLSTLAEESDATLLARLVRIETLLDALWRLPLRTIAIGQGRVTGAGADLFVACDHRLLATDASLAFPGARFGIVLGTRRLAARIGGDRALGVVSGGRTLAAGAALAAGLASAPLPEGLDPLRDTPWLTLGPPVVDRTTFAHLRQALDDHAGDGDLAALVRSAARPGLKARITAYRASLTANRPAPQA